MRDLDGIGSSHVLVKGGVGGSHLTTNYQGQKGAKGVFTLELKLIAEVGMVGYVKNPVTDRMSCSLHVRPLLQISQCRQIDTAVCSL